MRGTLLELAWIFLRLGFTSFGGPAAHIAMMEEEFVRRRKWISREHFLDMLGVVNLIPGPNSTELAIEIGRRRAGWAGLLVSGVSFIFPAVLIVTGIAALYVQYGQMPTSRAILYGVQPVILAVIVQALTGLGRSAMKSPALGGLALVSGVLAWLGVGEVLLILVAGLAAGFLGWRRVHRAKPSPATPHRDLRRALLATLAIIVVLPLGIGLWETGRLEYDLAGLFFFFLKVGSALYGSGYVLLAYLESDLVARWNWLTPQQLLDATAVGQFTPGPLFSTATFVGYLLGGPWGAILATVAIFLPAFLLVGLVGRFTENLRERPVFAAALDAVNAVAVAMMVVLTIRIGREALVNPVAWVLAIVSLAVLLRWKVNSAWLVLAGGLIGWLLQGQSP